MFQGGLEDPSTTSAGVRDRRLACPPSRRRRRVSPVAGGRGHAVLVAAPPAYDGGEDGPAVDCRLVRYLRVPLCGPGPSSSSPREECCLVLEDLGCRFDASILGGTEIGGESHEILTTPIDRGAASGENPSSDAGDARLARRAVEAWCSGEDRGRRRELDDGDVAGLLRRIRHPTETAEDVAARVARALLGGQGDTPGRLGRKSPRAGRSAVKKARFVVAAAVDEGSGSPKDGSQDGGSSPAPPEAGERIRLLPAGARRALVSITLRQTPSPDDDAGLPDVASDPLLRSCAKRLLAGRTVFFRPGDHPGSGAGVRLSIEVPVAGGGEAEMQLVVEEMRCRDDDDTEFGRGGGGCLCVILPSTRITFRGAEDGTRGVPAESEAVDVPPLPDRPTAPHEHLLHSLRSILFFGTDGGGKGRHVARSFLLSGPPGVGKTHGVGLAVSLANSWPLRCNGAGPPVELVSLRGSEIVASASNGSHASAALELEGHFSRTAARLSDDTTAGKAALIFLDEYDALASSRVLSAMLALCLDRMEGVVPVEDGTERGWGRLVVAGATNRADALPACLRRPGRLDKEVAVCPPDVEGRLELLTSLLGRSFESGGDGSDGGGLRGVAEACVGYVAADLSALVRRAALNGMERRLSRNKPEGKGGTPAADAPPTTSSITADDLFDAMSSVGASCLRDASLSAPPPTSWDDVAGDAGGAKSALVAAVEWPRTRRLAFEALGLRPPRGVLLHGPPGCAKTTLARAAAGAAGASFLSLSPADVYASSYVGEAESVVRRAFGLARSAAPCVLFFDEVDAVVGSGGSGGGGGGHGMERDGSAESRVLSTFLNEMDGVDGSAEDGVLVLAATNRPGTLDAALLRPGRFDRVIYVPPPDGPGRRAILEMEAGRWTEALLGYSAEADGSSPEGYFDLDRLAGDGVSGSMTGAEVVGACRESAVAVMRDLVERGEDALPPGGGGPTGEAAGGLLLRSLARELEAALARTRPLLSDEGVLLEYTKFEDDHG